MRRVAFLHAASVVAEPPPDPEEAREHALELSVLREACRRRDIELVPLVWSEHAAGAAGCDAAVIGTAWDYAREPQTFLARLSAWEEHGPLLNPTATVRWNLEKTYLRELAERGVPVVPTLWRRSADEDTVRAAFDELETDEIVVKPVVGQNAWRQVRLRRTDALPPAAELPPGAAMVQPFLPSVLEEGELSLLSFDRRLSHALRKLPRAGDYRIQATYGGREERCTPDEEARALHQRALAHVEGPLLQARVDLVRDRAGAWVLMELELIEPYLFPDQGPSTERVGDAWAQALERLLAER